MLKSLKNFLLSDLFIRNFIYSFVCLLVFVFLTLFSLKIFTKHNKTIKVPNFIGLDHVGLDSAISENTKFRYEIIDSVYDYSKVPGSVYTQIPQPFSNVKKNRKIYKKLNLKGIVRIDYIIKENKPYMIEVNTIPGMSKESIIPQQIKSAKIDIGKFMSNIIEECIKINQ